MIFILQFILQYHLHKVKTNFPQGNLSLCNNDGSQRDLSSQSEDEFPLGKFIVV